MQARIAPSVATKKTLVIVESPTKANLIGRFLGPEFDVAASLGHVRDLPKSKVGVDVEHGFEPTYAVSLRAKPVIADLKKRAKGVDRVILAPDPDREGEAIAWHLAEVLELGKKGAPEAQRIVFHEITERAVKEALAHPRDVDARLVDAQQARRVLDRLVGYGLSPFLWRKIRYGLSAGRVQSVAVRLVVEREREIRAFESREYWSVEGVFDGAEAPVPARLTVSAGTVLKKFTLENGTMADAAVEAAKEARPYRVETVTTKRVARNPAPPFTTSTLQQEASRKLGFSAKQTMAVAQKLYEKGLITYMRTDSVHLSSSATAQAREVLTSLYGAEFALETPRHYKTKSKGAQEAHEAIRPTSLERSPDRLSSGERNEARLYDLVWKRTLASQASPAQIDQTAADIAGDGSTFRANGNVTVFPGFIRVYTEGTDGDDEVVEGALPPLREGQELVLASVAGTRHETEPPPRYTDATLVKALESHGIGRPSTYAPTLTTIQDRGYVERVDKKYAPTDVGELVTDLLVEHFPEVADPSFTAKVEDDLDDIAEGSRDWREVLAEFYDPFKKNLDEKEESVAKVIVVTDTPCPHCGKPMLMKFGRTGQFLACPEEGSKVTLPTPEEAAEIAGLQAKLQGDEACPLCGKEMKIRKGRFGFFLGCVDYPSCKGVGKIWDRTGYQCPHCRNEGREPQGDIVVRKGRGRSKPFFGCNRYPDCSFLMNVRPESQEQVMEAYSAWLAAPKKKPAAKKKTARKKSAKKASKKSVPKKTAA